MRILVVDDEQDLCEILQYNLETEGYEVHTANSAEEALSLPLETFNLILLDVMMGEMSGFQMALKMKENPVTAHVPIIFITALEGEDSLVRGLNIGADDYMTKPFAIEELLARIRVALRKAAKQKDRAVETVLSCKGVELRPDAHEVAVCGEKVELTIREFTLLQTLLEHKNIVLSRDTLIDQVWGYDYYVETNIVDVYIRYLRHKIDDRFQIHLISTVRGIGYVIKED